ncbi:inner centromere protein-like [Periplaneta americana]|uniref:inner centromere protein-like n=1 Tax=Periplaneta americana TaxID=6978 RepID=UPI0037E87FEE
MPLLQQHSPKRGSRESQGRRPRTRTGSSTSANEPIPRDVSSHGSSASSRSASIHAVEAETPLATEQDEQLPETTVAESAPESGEPAPPRKLTMEDRMDEHFMEILGYIRNNLKNLSEEQDRGIAQAWLEKLCGEALEGLQCKRSRNIYLFRLACQLAEPNSQLSPPFMEAPPKGNLVPAEIMFGLQKPEEEKPPDWMDEMTELEENVDITHISKDGRTYLATQKLPGGVGAFGYLAVTLAEDKPLWVKPGDGLIEPTSKTTRRKKKIRFCKGPARILPDEEAQQRRKLTAPSGRQKFEIIEPLLSKRCSPEERDKLFHFYDTLMEVILIEAETCGCGKGPRNEQIERLLATLEKDLREEGNETCLCEMLPTERRKYLLDMLYKRTEERKKEIEEREAALDQLEKLVKEPGIDDAEEEEETDEDLTEDLWSIAAGQGPSEENMKRLVAIYPPELVDRFLKLLSVWRQDMIRRCRNRHENIVAAMKKDLQAEVKLGLEKYKQARDAWMRVAKALQEVQAAERQAKEDKEMVDIIGKQTILKQARSRAKLVNQLIAEIKDAQRHFELERVRGQKLREQLNLEHQRNEEAKQMSEAAMAELRADADTLHNEIIAVESDLDEQAGRIRELKLLYEAIC